MIFSAKWTIDELSTIMQMPPHALRRKMAFWQSHGMLKEEATDVFILVEEVKGRSHDTVVMEEEEVESAMATAQDKKEEELNVSNTIKHVFHGNRPGQESGRA